MPYFDVREDGLDVGSEDFSPDDVARPVVAYGGDMVTRGTELAVHAHARAQLVLTLRGVVRCETDEGVWIVPPRCAVWIPGGVAHSVTLAGNVRVYCLFVEPGASLVLPRQCCTLSVSPLLQQLVLKVAQMPALYDVLVNDGREVPVYGRRLREDIRRYYGSTVMFAARGAMVPNEHSFCELDPAVKDRWGIPALRFHWKWGEQERGLAAHARRSFEDMIAAMGGRVQPLNEESDGADISIGGSTNHEVGTVRMGASPRDSVLNAHSQSWDVPNLYIIDGSVLPTGGAVNPTSTIGAMTMRAATNLRDRFAAVRAGALLE